VNPLTELRDIHLPKPISFWPLAPGWYIVLAIIVLMIVIGIIIIYKRQQKRKIPKAILHQLQQLKQQTDNAAVIAALSSLLKRAALSFYPREKVAKLQGKEWLLFLDKTSNTNAFTQGVGRVFMIGPYQTQSEYNVEELTLLIENWIKHHV